MATKQEAVMETIKAVFILLMLLIAVAITYYK